MSSTSKDLPTAPEGQIRAVLLPCDGERRATFESITISLNHECFDLPAAPISAMIGFPIVVYKTNSLPLSVPRGTLDNQIATFLQIDPDSGFAPPVWQNNVGTCIIARKDKKPLDVRHFEAVWMYNDRMLDVFGDGLTGQELRAEDWQTKEHFVNWFESYSEAQVMNGRESFGTMPPLF